MPILHRPNGSVVIRYPITFYPEQDAQDDAIVRLLESTPSSARAAVLRELTRHGCAAEHVAKAEDEPNVDLMSLGTEL